MFKLCLKNIKDLITCAKKLIKENTMVHVVKWFNYLLRCTAFNIVHDDKV